jgi:hypothetical protein
VRSELIQEFAAVTEQLAHWALVRLPEDFIHREGAYAFNDRVKDQDVKQHSSWAATDSSVKPLTQN